MSNESDSERIENLEKIVVDLHKFFKAHHESIGGLVGMVRILAQSNVEVCRTAESLLSPGDSPDRGKISETVEEITTKWNKANAALVKIESQFKFPPPSSPVG